MNNEFLGILTSLIEDFLKDFEDIPVGKVSVGKNEDYEFFEDERQTADSKHELLEDVEYVSQSEAGDSGDWFEGILIRKIINTDYCLVLEYST
ncbi:hypothetical protein [Enterococcus sp.]|uniref:hypothetical protein n=1 Tax=Enterococcus sp. TaxID=35783 RepID=UPI002FCAC3E0